MKTCTKCQTEKPLSDFGKDNRKSDKLTTWCKTCRSKEYKKWYYANLDKVRERRQQDRVYRKEYYNDPKRKKKYREKYIERKFKIPYSRYDDMLSSQNGLCAICMKSETSSNCKYLSIDHCHSTGKIRGLLCVSCNRGLGMFWDKQELLLRAATYLEKHRS